MDIGDAWQEKQSQQQDEALHARSITLRAIAHAASVSRTWRPRGNPSADDHLAKQMPPKRQGQLLQRSGEVVMHISLALYALMRKCILVLVVLSRAN